MMRLSAACAALILSGCQTLGLESDPDQATKLAIAASGIMVDAVGVYGHLPPCGVDPCRVEKRYRDAKLIAQAVGGSFEALRHRPRASWFLTAALLYGQYEIAKTIGDSPAPTLPEEPPMPATIATLEAAGLADILISTADERVRDAASVNTTIPELLDALGAKVAALP